jgi:RNA polymerase sigma factor (sigma-70 family)
MTDPSPLFATTHWSVVMKAGGSDPDAARSALSSLCEGYWYPLYAFLRRRGSDTEEARDLTQGFFADLLERGDLGTADPERGRFRSFLLGSLKHFAANEHERERALKRGGDRPRLSLDFEAAEGRYQLEPPDNRTPERLFEAQWARELLDRVVDRLRGQYVEEGKRELFDRLVPCLAGDAEAQPYAEISRALEMTEGAVKVAAHRLRRRFRVSLRSEISQTVATPEDVEDEIRALFSALAG